MLTSIGAAKIEEAYEQLHTVELHCLKALADVPGDTLEERVHRLVDWYLDLSKAHEELKTGRRVTAQLKSSYPYFALSRERNIPYRTVLLIADFNAHKMSAPGDFGEALRTTTLDDRKEIVALAARLASEKGWY